MAKISIDHGLDGEFYPQITVKLSQRNIDQLNDPYTPPEYSLWKKVTVDGKDYWLNIVLESDSDHYALED